MHHYHTPLEFFSYVHCLRYLQRNCILIYIIADRVRSFTLVLGLRVRAYSDALFDSVQANDRCESDWTTCSTRFTHSTHRFRCARCRRASAQLIETWSNFGAQVNQWGNVAKYGSVMVRLGRADWNVHSYSIKDSERIEWLRMDEAWRRARQASISPWYSKFERCVTTKSEPESVSLSFDWGPITPYSV